MRVTIKYEQSSQGLLSKKPLFVVSLATQLSAEETAAIQAVGLADTTVIEHERNGIPLNCTAGQLIRGGANFQFDNFTDALNFTSHIKGRLETLKGVIAAAVQVKSGTSETYEL
jgi:hypothetical protein